MRRGVRAALATQAVASGGQFLLSLVLVRELGLAGFGVVAMVLLGASHVAGLVQALIAQPLVAMGCTSQRVTVAAVASLVVSGAAGALGAGAAHSFGVGAGPVFALVTARGVAPVLRSAVFAVGGMRVTLAVDALAGFGALALVIAFGAATVDRALIAVAGASLLAAVVGGSAIPWDRVSSGEARSIAVRAWGSGRWLALNQVASWFGSGGFLWAAAVILGPVTFGAIRTAQTVVGVLGSALQALELTLPLQARAVVERDPREIGPWIVQTAIRLAGIFGVAGCVIAIGSDWIASLVVAPGEVAMTARAIAVLAWVPVVGAFTGVLHVGFRAVERTRPLFVAYSVASLLAACAAMPMVRAFGLEGATVGLLGSQMLFAVLLAGCLDERFGILAKLVGIPRAARGTTPP